MTTKRIRCSCGRVYDPVKRPVCPDCGAANVVVAAPEPAPEKAPTVSKAPSDKPISPRPSPTPLNPRVIAIGGAVLALLVVVAILSRCGGRGKTAAVVPSPTAVQASVSPTAPVGTLTPNETPAIAQKETIATPAPAPAIETPEPSSRAVEVGIDLADLIAKAAPNAQIKVPPGTYRNIVLIRPIQLIGEGNKQALIMGQGKEALVVKTAGASVQNIQFLCEGIGALPAISVTAGASLDMDACTVQSDTALGLLATGKGSIKAIGTKFTVPNGAAIRLTEAAKANLTQCQITDTKIGLNLWGGSIAELHSCAFDRDGGPEGGGSVIALNGKNTAVTADDCHFNSNTAGLLVAKEGSLTITKSLFKENTAGAEGGILGLISVRDGSHATLTNDDFESNRQGIAAIDGGRVEMTGCQLVRNGLDQRQVVPASLPLLVSGDKAYAAVRKSTFAASAQYAIGVMAGGELNLEETDISGSRIAGIILGERNAVAVRATIRGSHFHNNGTGLGLLAGSSAELENCDFRENNDGIIAFDSGTQLNATRTAILSNRDRGLYVYSAATATLLDCDLKNNARGAISGTRGRASERATITLENCRLGGNSVFGAGAAAQSELILTNCVFDGTDKTNIYKERGANVQTGEPASPVPSPTSPGPAETSPTPGESVTPSDSPSPSGSPSPSPSPSPAHEKIPSKPHHKPTPRPHPPTPEDIRRALRKLLPGN